MGIPDFEPEGIALQHMPTQQSGFPKAHPDLPPMLSLPPTYDEAVSGRDRSVMVEEHPTPVATAELQQGGGDNQRTVGSEIQMSVGGAAMSVDLLPERQQLSSSRVLMETELLPPPPYSPSPAPPVDVDDEEEDDSGGDDQPLLPAYTYTI